MIECFRGLPKNCSLGLPSAQALSPYFFIISFIALSIAMRTSSAC